MSSANRTVDILPVVLQIRKVDVVIEFLFRWGHKS